MTTTIMLTTTMMMMTGPEESDEPVPVLAGHDGPGLPVVSRC